MKTILNNMPVEANLLVPKMDAIQNALDGVAKVVIGGFGAKNTVASRLRFASFATGSAHADITGAQKEQLNLAREGYNSQSGALHTLYDTTLPALEQEFQDAGGVLFNIPPQRRRFFDEKN